MQEVVDAALEEDAQGVAVSSYQGGHVEYFEYLVESLREAGAEHVKVVGGGGGVIVPAEIKRLRESGVTIFSPEDGQKMGLVGMINSVVADCDFDPWEIRQADLDAVLAGDRLAIARALTGAETGQLADEMLGRVREAAGARGVPVLGITGTGGSGKSSLTDELVRRFRVDQQDKLRIGVIAVDPTRRKGGGALLGDRIRANSLDGDRVFFRSLATRGSHEVPEHLDDVIDVMKAAGFDLVVVETPGIGQGDAAIVPFVDHLALRDDAGVRRRLAAGEDRHARLRRHRGDQQVRAPRRQGRAARRRSSDGPQPRGLRQAARRHAGLRHQRRDLQRRRRHRALPAPARHSSPARACPSPRARSRTSTYGTPPASARSCPPSACATSPRSPRPSAATTPAPRRSPRRRVGCSASSSCRASSSRPASRPTGSAGLLEAARKTLPHEVTDQLEAWPAVVESYSGDEQVVRVRDKEIHTKLTRESLSGNKIPRVSLPRFTDHGELRALLARENLPGFFPFTAGVFPFKRDGEDPARMFAGEGDPVRTNRRFKILSHDGEATRLSTAFDSVTLYGRDPDPRPDVYGKVGTSGVSVATLDDMKVLYDGFDLVAPSTSVSMTINGPAPTVLAFFLNTVIDQQVEKFREREDRDPDQAEHDELAAYALANVRGTVQADILKEDQGQNTAPVLHRVLPADDGRHPGVVHRAAGPQLLLGLDLRLPHRRGRGEPDQPARLHPGQRLHLRRGLPRARHGHRRLRAQPVVLLLQRHGPRVLRASAASPAASGRSR